MQEKKKKLGLLPRLIIAIILGIIIGSFMPEVVIRVLATFNGIFGNFLGFVIPLIIVGFVAPGIGDLGKSAGKILLVTVVLAYVSTLIAGSLAYGVDSIIFPNIIKEGSMLASASNPGEALLAPYFKVEMPPLMGVMSALLIAFTLGIGMAVIDGKRLNEVMHEFQNIIEKLISAIIIPLLPVHICGIFANMTQAGEVQMLMAVFLKVYVVIIALHVAIILLQYFVAGTVAKTNPFKAIKNMIPAYLTAIGTQSSAATIPVTLRQTLQNNVSPRVAQFVIPLCATIHLSGSTITLTSCALAVMMLHGMPFSFATMFPFIIMLGVTMVAAPGVPGGAVMAALGVLESMLHFNPTMLSLMIALYLAQDSFGTACNITGDGAIALIVNKIAGKESTSTSSSSSTMTTSTSTSTSGAYTE
ncbi:MAG: dicarboxylate/amino acid:cation symporter [Aminobacterium sp.]|jgi:Na+/H+-dicarboxylate symporter|uniref:dicarboxylate/amino acid:cation symporter n=1 Tax=unclassified Aminobacterium TaxID=2685012 RepID=UPI001BCEA7C9|nr:MULTISPECIES: dicarboxylate/amino acid:cation symporter [unclassified Aminobacterium]MDD2206860.1 dicarboxylate/amino acid:cation symporter [Aminobacterium sp.]MDD3425406.1 dicarboxylate/amino acid:cation symporter [Aminobacterium sp.]MDD3707884.1 dicarboxylate/amino acid:cation symporter [Aminobacterium sp.]MDD4229495.1 dicarboxylate/amino acid:cation symporter [Aminobacterium sp.]MDD4551019.1 dicarboxylate/amino acid:cation symporter [Aminobacterium sp.]